MAFYNTGLMIYRFTVSPKENSTEITLYHPQKFLVMYFITTNLSQKNSNRVND